MKIERRKFVGTALSTLVLTLPGWAATADRKKMVRVIVAYGAGGASDTIARYVAEKITNKVGTQVVVENRPGADGNIAAEAVARTSSADDYTLLVSGPSTHAANISMYKKLPFDPETDFRPMTTLVNTPYILVVNKDRVKEKTVQQFVATAKEKEKSTFFASANVGGRIAGELFRLKSGIDAVNVPYKASSQAMTDLIGGQFDYYFCDSVTAIPQIRAGKINALAVSSIDRLDSLPDVPSLHELGYKNFDVSSWIAIWSAAVVPEDVSNRMAGWIAEVLETEEARKFFSDKGMQVLPGSPEKLEAIQKRDTVEWGKIIRVAGMQK